MMEGLEVRDGALDISCTVGADFRGLVGVTMEAGGDLSGGDLRLIVGDLIDETLSD